MSAAFDELCSGYFTN